MHKYNRDLYRNHILIASIQSTEAHTRSINKNGWIAIVKSDGWEYVRDTMRAIVESPHTDNVARNWYAEVLREYRIRVGAGELVGL